MRIVDIGAIASGSESDPGYLKDITGASFALLMDEASGNLADVVASVPLSVYNAANTYSVTGFTGYDPGITMNPTAGGFYRAPAATAGLDFGTGDGNIKLAMRYDAGTRAAQQEIFITTIREAGMPGFSVRSNKAVDAANSNASIQLIAADFTTVTATWAGNEIGDAVFNGGYHTWEFFLDRAGDASLVVDGITQTPDGSVSLAAIAGKSISTTASSGIGLGCDWRPGIDREIPITVNFVRVKKSL